MQEGPEIRFARTGSRHIACQVFGSGSLDLLVFSSAVIAIESMDEEPSLARFHRRCALGVAKTRGRPLQRVCDSVLRVGF
jgi:hypothetical protein